MFIIKCIIVKNLLSFLLIGSIIMLTAEVFAGSVQFWFIDIWALLVTFPLYLCHLLLFFNIAFYFKKISLSSLYVLGMIFGLYEAILTKILWTGYIGSDGFLLGEILGVGIAEFVVLVFFWHPIFSFIIPLFLFQILSGKYIENHLEFFKKSIKKTIIIIFFLFLVSSFIVFNYDFNIIIGNSVLIISALLILVFDKINNEYSLIDLTVSKLGFIIISFYITLLYIILSIVSINPLYSPSSMYHYILIVFSYILFILLFLISKKLEFKIIKLKDFENETTSLYYSRIDLLKFLSLLLLFFNILVLLPFTTYIFIFGYLLYFFIGSFIFIAITYKTLHSFIKSKI